jgi:hypothetical protein
MDSNSKTLEQISGKGETARETKPSGLLMSLVRSFTVPPAWSRISVFRFCALKPGLSLNESWFIKMFEVTCPQQLQAENVKL